MRSQLNSFQDFFSGLQYWLLELDGLDIDGACQAVQVYRDIDSIGARNAHHGHRVSPFEFIPVELALVFMSSDLLVPEWQAIEFEVSVV